MQDSGASGSQVPPFTCIVAGSDGSAFAADANGVDYQLTTEDPDSGTATWTPLTSSVALTRLAATSASDVWGLDGTGAVYRSQGTSWNPVAVPGGQPLDQISAAADGTVWGVRSGIAYQYSGTAFVAQGQASCAAVAVGGAGGVFALAASGDAEVLLWDGSTWGPFYPNPPSPLTGLSASDDGMLWGVGTDGNLYMSVGAPDEWTAVGSGLSQVSAASASYIWALDTTGVAQALQYGSPLLAEDTPVSAGIAGWDTESVFDQSQSTHLWLVYQAATLAGAQGGADGQAASDLVKPQTFRVKGPIGDAFHDGLCHGLHDADFNDPWRDFSGLWGKVGQATYKSHFYDPDTGNNWKGQSDPTALTRGRGTATMALDCYAAGDLSSAGYYLGVALHYLTDATQAMHAQNFTWLSSRPFGWHSAYEERAMKLTGTGSLQVNPNYIAPPADAELDWFYVTAATNAKRYLSAICPPIVYQPSPPLDRWPDQADAIFATSLPSTEAMLADAIEVTARFLVAWTALAENRDNEVVCFVSADTGGLVTSNGNWLNQWPFEGSGAQKWWAVPLSGADDGYYQIRWFSPDSAVLDASGQSRGSGVQINGWNGGDNQKWKIVEGEMGQIRLQGKQSGLFLTINEVQTPDSGLVIQPGPASGAGPEGQNWIMVPWEPGALGCTAGSLVADVQGNSKKALAPLELYTPNQQPNQTFLLVPVQQDQSAPDEQVFVILIANQGMAVDVTSSFGVVQNPWSGADSQRWSRVDVGDATTFMLESVAYPGDAITVQGDGTQTEELLGLAGTSGQAQQVWQLITPLSQLATATFPAEARRAEGLRQTETSPTHASPA